MSAAKGAAKAPALSDFGGLIGFALALADVKAMLSDKGAVAETLGMLQEAKKAAEEAWRAAKDRQDAAEGAEMGLEGAKKALSDAQDAVSERERAADVAVAAAKRDLADAKGLQELNRGAARRQAELDQELTDRRVAVTRDEEAAKAEMKRLEAWAAGLAKVEKDLAAERAAFVAEKAEFDRIVKMLRK